MVLSERILKVKKHDLEAEEGEREKTIFKTDYIRITQHNYGRMTPETVGRGLCTDHVASCTAIVLHSPTTQRTILANSPNFTHKASFIPLVDWVTGGDGREDFTEEQIVAYMSGGFRPPTKCTLEIVVLRGYMYGQAGDLYGHSAWMHDLRNMMNFMAISREINLTITDSPRLLQVGAILVDKGTGALTYLELSAGAQTPHGLIVLRNRHTSLQYAYIQELQDIFMGTLYSAHEPAECVPLHMQFDGARFCLPHALSDEARQLIRSRRHGQPPAAQSGIVRRLGLSLDWINRFDHPLFALLNNHFQNTARIRPCERCAREGVRNCQGCLGAWYCGEEHQREDWKNHKMWCTSHRWSDGAGPSHH